MRKFTLLELLIVVAIIGILVSLLLPSLGKAREVSKRAVCLSNMKQMHIASTLYESTYNNLIPLGYEKAFQGNYYYKKSGNYTNQGKLGAFTDFNSGFLYCPSQAHNLHQYNTKRNKWAGRTVRTSMSSGPIADYYKGELISSVSSASLEPNYALLSDAISEPTRQTHWREGNNVVKIAGQGKFIRADSTIKAYLNRLSGRFSSSKNPIFEAMWEYLTEK